MGTSVPETQKTRGNQLIEPWGRHGDGASRASGRPQNGGLISFFVGKARRGSRGDTRFGPEQRNPLGLRFASQHGRAWDRGITERLSRASKRRDRLRLRPGETKRLRPLDARVPQQMI